MRKPKTIEKFIEEAIKKHGLGRYDYSEVNYINAQKHVPIKCNVCGRVFEQTPNKHLLGRGCPYCACNKRKTLEQFLEDCSKVHGDKFDYSETDYKNNKSIIAVICKECNTLFYQVAGNHLKGQGCPTCAHNQKLTTEEFIKRSIEIHGQKYGYSDVNYVNAQTEVPIFCKKHGIFYQKPLIHLRGAGCAQCSFEKRTMSLEEFIKRAREVHGDKYDYSQVIYKNNRTPVIIICKKHGPFLQSPSNHLRDQGCPKCAAFRSKGEREMCEYIKSLYNGKVLENTRKFICGLELDIYLPELKLAFEYNGEHWHKLREEEQPGYHEDKRNRCKKEDIILVEIWENDWKKNPTKTKELIRNKLLDTYLEAI